MLGSVDQILNQSHMCFAVFPNPPPSHMDNVGLTASRKKKPPSYLHSVHLQNSCFTAFPKALPLHRGNSILIPRSNNKTIPSFRSRTRQQSPSPCGGRSRWSSGRTLCARDSAVSWIGGIESFNRVNTWLRKCYDRPVIFVLRICKTFDRFRSSTILHSHVRKIFKTNTMFSSGPDADPTRNFSATHPIHLIQFCTSRILSYTISWFNFKKCPHSHQGSSQRGPAAGRRACPADCPPNRPLTVINR